jgi:rubredoxin
MSSADWGDEDSRSERQKLFDRVASGAYLDGIMSPLSRELAERFNVSTEAIDMTLAWACTPKEWTCPACRRGKRDIARLTDKGKLMCRLVEHHDHMADLVEAEFERQCKTHGKIVADEFAKRFAKRASQMVAAYDNTIICDDCNTADPKAKREADAHKDFSYSPQEISQFVKAKPNVPHEIDPEEARRIWLEQAETFKLRLTIVARIAAIAATNNHWYQEVPRAQRAEEIYSTAKFLAASYGSLTSLYELAGDKRRPAADVSAWRKTIHQPPRRAPRPEDLDYIAKVSCAKSWSKVDDMWHCPCCQRKKFHTVRLSNKNKWVFDIFAPSFYATTERYGTNRGMVCQDCSSLATALGREACLALGVVDESAYAKFLTAQEVALVALSYPHRQHNVDNDQADKLVMLLVERIKHQRTS